MLRGAQKNMIVVRTRDSRLFEEAYFVMRRNAKAASTDEMDMLWEANRILETAASKEYPPPVRNEKRSRFGLLHSMIWFGIGLLSGSGVMGLLWYLF
jgi:hypothetical protein